MNFENIQYLKCCILYSCGAFSRIVSAYLRRISGAPPQTTHVASFASPSPPPPTPQTMANVLSVLAKKRTLSALVIALIYCLFKAKRHYQQQYSPQQQQPSTSSHQRNQKRSKHAKVGVNAHFIKQMKQLLPICIPGTCYLYVFFFSKHTSHTTSLALILSFPLLSVSSFFVHRPVHKRSRSFGCTRHCFDRPHLAGYLVRLISLLGYFH